MHGTSISFISQLLSFILNTLGTIILARLLAPSDFGLVAMVLAICLLFQKVVFSGIVDAIIQSNDINHSQASTLFWVNLGFSTIFMVLFIISSPVIVWIYNEPRVKPLVIAMAFSIPVIGLSCHHKALILRNMQFYRNTFSELSASLISFCISIALALLNFGYWALIAKWLIHPAIITISVWLLCSWRPSLPSKSVNIRPLLRFAMHTNGTILLSQMRRIFDKMLIGRYLGAQSLGYYDRAYQFSNIFSEQLIGPIANVGTPTFSRLSDDKESYNLNFLKVLSVLSFICFLMTAVLTITGKDLIVLFLGDKWAKTGVIFSILNFSAGPIVLYSFHAWIHLSLGNPDRLMIWSIISFLITLACYFVGIKYGVIGVAIGYSTSIYLLLIPSIWYACHPLKLPFSQIISSMWQYFLAAIGSIGLSFYFLYIYSTSSNLYFSINIFYRFLVSGMTSTFLYVLIIFILFRSLNPFTQIFRILSKIFLKTS